MPRSLGGFSSGSSRSPGLINLMGRGADCMTKMNSFNLTYLQFYGLYTKDYIGFPSDGM